MQHITRRWIYTVVISLVVTGVILAAWYCYQWYHAWKYPYGSSHCCDVNLMLALGQYADEHGGAYPAGKGTPEASLCLLYPEYTSAYNLGGKTTPEGMAESILQRGEPLTPDTCGWHYVEGLSKDDDPRLALLWDKARLGHWGERTSDGSTKVLLANGDYRFVSASEWDDFLAEQNKLLAARKAKKRK